MWYRALQSMPAVAVGAVVLGRLGMLRRPGSSRTLWIALAFLAAGLAFYSPPIFDAVNHATGSVRLSAAAREVFGLGVFAGVRAMCAVVGGWPARIVRRDWVLAGVAAVVVSLAVLTVPADQVSPLLARSMSYYAAGWRGWVYLMPALGYLSWSLWTGTGMCRRYSVEAGPGPLRTGLRLIGAGTVAGFGFVAVKLVLQVVWQLGDQTHAWMMADRAGQTAILAASGLLVAAGASWEVLVQRAGTVRAWWWATRARVALQPLWSALVVRYPEVALPAGRGLRHARFHLLRQVVEIRDGLLALGDEVPDDLASAVGAVVGAAAAEVGNGGRDAAATEVALTVWVVTVGSASSVGVGSALGVGSGSAGSGSAGVGSSGGGRGSDSGSVLIGGGGPEVGGSRREVGGAGLATIGGNDLESEVQWLITVAQAYRSPTMRELAGQVGRWTAGAPAPLGWTPHTAPIGS